MTRMEPPKSYVDKTKKIVSSWKRPTGNYMLVSPPLTDPAYIFGKLRDPSFQEENGVSPESIAVAYLPQSKYDSVGSFVDLVLREWEIGDSGREHYHDELDRLEDAVESMASQQRRPVILIPEFHKAIDRLTFALGARLREMGSEYDLRTVVEIPVKWSSLQDRWSADESKDTFICSGFGQAHSCEILDCFDKNEMEKISKQEKLTEPMIAAIVKWSGGIPELFKASLELASTSGSLQEFERRMRDGSLDQCKRFIDWIEAPGTNTIKEVVKNVWECRAAQEEELKLRGHDWSTLLLDGSGNIKSSAVGFACANSIGTDYNQVLSFIVDAVSRKRIEEVDALVAGLKDSYRSEGQMICITSVIPIWKIAQESEPDWDDVYETAKRARSRLNNSASDSADRVRSAINKWISFSGGMRYFYRYIQDNEKDHCRLADMLSGRSKAKEDSAQAAVQLVVHLLNIADTTEDRRMARQSILSLPEQILQIFCGRMLSIEIWNAPDFGVQTYEKVQESWIGKEYEMPSKGSRLGFNHLLNFGWAMMDDLEAGKRLFTDKSEVNYWRKWYTEFRGPEAHSIGSIDKIVWDKQKKEILALANKLSLVLLDEESTKVLPDFSIVLSELAKELE